MVGATNPSHLKLSTYNQLATSEQCSFTSKQTSWLGESAWITTFMSGKLQILFVHDPYYFLLLLNTTDIEPSHSFKFPLVADTTFSYTFHSGLALSTLDTLWQNSASWVDLPWLVNWLEERESPRSPSTEVCQATTTAGWMVYSSQQTWSSVPCSAILHLTLVTCQDISYW